MQIKKIMGHVKKGNKTQILKSLEQLLHALPDEAIEDLYNNIIPPHVHIGKGGKKYYEQ